MKPDTLYNLLPAVYRIRDIERGNVLQALMQVIGEQAAYLHADIEHLYDNWFIETCDDWVVPYLGELVGFRRTHPAGEPGDVATSSSVELIRRLYPRREISRLIDTRRRKGTLPVLEDVALNLAGWRARAVENYCFLSHSSIAKYSCAISATSAHVRKVTPMARAHIGQVGFSVDLRAKRATTALSWPNLNGLTLYVWRRQPLSVSHVRPHVVCTQVKWQLVTFSPFGFHTPLVARDEVKKRTDDKETSCRANQSQQVTTSKDTRAEDIETKKPEEDELRFSTFLRRKLLRQDLFRKSPRYYGPKKSLFVDGVTKDQISIKDLRQPNVLATLSDKKKVYIDPEFGLMAVHANPERIPNVTYHYPILAEMGGGEYTRTVAHQEQYPVYRFLPTSRMSDASRLNAFISVQPEIETKNDSSTILSSVGFELAGSTVHFARLRKLRIRQNQTFELRAANKSRPVVKFENNNVPQPIRIELEPGSRLVVDGVMILAEEIDVRYVEPDINLPATPKCDCDLQVTQQHTPPSIFIRHSTIVPSIDRSQCNRMATNRRDTGLIKLCLPGGNLSVRDSVLAALQIEDICETSHSCPRSPIALQIWDSIVARDMQGGAPGQPAFAALDCARSTILGATHVHQINGADDMIFFGRVDVSRRQVGYIRFSYVEQIQDPMPNSLPRRFRCQPASDSMITPRFVSESFGDFGYAELHIRCPVEIWQGAESQSEMGAFHNQLVPQRRTRLESQLEDFTPANMRSRLVFADETRP